MAEEIAKCPNCGHDCHEESYECNVDDCDCESCTCGGCAMEFPDKR